MDRHVSVTLFKSIVFLDVVQVVATDDNSPLHLHLLDNTSQNPTTDGDISSEWALLVNVGAFDSLVIQIKLVPFSSINSCIILSKSKLLEQDARHSMLPHGVFWNPNQQYGGSVGPSWLYRLYGSRRWLAVSGKPSHSTRHKRAHATKQARLIHAQDISCYTNQSLEVAGLVSIVHSICNRLYLTGCLETQTNFTSVTRSLMLLW